MNVLPHQNNQAHFSNLGFRFPFQVQSPQGIGASSLSSLPAQHILPGKVVDVHQVDVEGINVGTLVVTSNGKGNPATNKTRISPQRPGIGMKPVNKSVTASKHSENELPFQNSTLSSGLLNSNESMESLKMTKPLKTQEKTARVTEEDIKSFKAHDENTCFVCDLIFIENDLLLEHLKSTQFFCRVCTNAFQTHSDLEKHFTSYKGSKCSTCEQVFFFKRDLMKHFKINEACNKSKNVPCEICSKTFPRNSGLNQHMKIVHSTGRGTFECVVCKKDFHTETQFISHQRSCHVAYELIPCQQCHELYLGPYKLKFHIRKTHLEVLNNEVFKCDICEKTFKNKHTLDKHLLTHDRTEVLCEHCGQAITGGRSSMNSHLRRRHPELYTVRRPKKFQRTCKICLELFDSQDKLNEHRKLFHTEKRHFCEICGKSFKTNTILKHHYAVHSDERNFKCDMCGATFKQKVVLRTHSRIHDDSPKFACENCGRSFRWKQTYDKHLTKCRNSHERLESDISDD